MAAPAEDEFAVLDQLIVRALVTLRAARAACRAGTTPKTLAVQEHAQADLDALLDTRSAARRRLSARAAPATVIPEQRLRV
jgi:hypothetical protein